MRSEELDLMQHHERLRIWRNWSCLAALVSYALAVTTVWNTVGNPKTWASAYHALAAAGGLAWLSIPLLVVGAVFLVVALVLTVLLQRK